MSKRAAAPHCAAAAPVADALSRGRSPGAISRRAAIGGMLAAAMTPAVLTRAWASEGSPTGVNDPGQPPGPATPLPRQNHTATTLQDGRVLIAGGSYLGTLSSVQIYDPNSNTWTDAAPLLAPREQHTAVLMADGSVLVAGGVYTDPLSSTEIYDPGSNTWTPGPSLTIPRTFHSAAAVGGRAMVFGGVYIDRLSSVEMIGGSLPT